MNFLRPDFFQMANDNVAKVDWLARLRLVATFGQLIMIPVGLYNNLIHVDDLPFVFLLITSLLLTNIVVWKSLALRKMCGQTSVFFYLCLDFVFFSVFLYLTSGFRNPLINLCFLHFALAGLCVSPKFGGLFFIWSTFLLTYLFHSSFEYPWSGQAITLIATYIFVGLTILVVSQWFSRTMNRYKESIMALRIQLGQVDSLRASGLVAASICHELATPLNEAVLKVDEIRQQLRDEDDSSACNQVENLLLYCGQKLNSVFSETSMEENQRFERTDMVKLIARTANNWRDRICPNQAMTLDLPHDPVYREIPSILFIRTLMDLLDNSLDAIEESLGDIRVSIFHLQDGKIEVTVEDSGQGFQSEIRQQIGSPFITNKTDGIGLGLYTASHLAFYLGGSLEIANSDLGGARVALVF